MAKTKSGAMKSLFDKDTLIRVGCTVGGLAVGTVANGFLSKTKEEDPAKTTIGLSTDIAKWVNPILLLGAGLLGNGLCKSPIVKDASFGLAAAGAASLANTIAGKSFVSLNGTDPEPVIPGVGTTAKYVQLPSNNYLMTHYDKDRKPIGNVEPTPAEVDDDTNANDPNDNAVGATTTPINLMGVTETTLL